MEQQLVVFDLADESYAINISTVESIIKIQSITMLPHSKAYIKGVINLRGAVLPVIDLRIRFGLEPQPATRQTRIMVVNMSKLKVGVVVDSVSEVLRVPDDCIEALPPTVSAVNSTYLKNIINFEKRLIILLDLSRIIDIDEQQSLAALQPKAG